MSLDEATTFYDHVDLEDFDFESEIGTYFYPCPCGDRFQITIEQLDAGEDVARCPSCSLAIKVIYDFPEQTRAHFPSDICRVRAE